MVLYQYIEFCTQLIPTRCTGMETPIKARAEGARGEAARGEAATASKASRAKGAKRAKRRQTATATPGTPRTGAQRRAPERSQRRSPTAYVAQASSL